MVKTVARYKPEIILAVGRGGYYPGTLIAHMLRAEIYPVRLSRRVQDQVKYDSPQWLVKPPDAVQGRRVLIVDEISDSGETLAVVKTEVEKLGAGQVKSAVLYAHTRSQSVPDYIGLITDALILNPWDREIFQDGEFQWHPEYLAALEAQDIEREPSLLIDAAIVTIAKGQDVD